MASDTPIIDVWTQYLSPTPPGTNPAGENVFRNYGMLDEYHGGTNLERMIARMDAAGVKTALMAGENVPERVVRKVFSSSIDLVIHLDRSWDQSGMRVLRQMTEIRAVVPALHDDFSSEPIFARSRIGAPLEWSGALPPARLSERLERAGGPGAGGLRSVLEHGARSW